MCLTPSKLLDEFEARIVKCANKVASTQSRSRSDWFSQAEYILINSIDKRNEAFKNFMKKPSEEYHQVLKIMRHNLLREKRGAKHTKMPNGSS